VASHLGHAQPLVIAWPDRIKDAGGIRTQFHHVIDISPTILEAAHLPQPVEVNGVKQKPIEGVSMVYSFDDPKATSPRHSILRDVRKPSSLQSWLDRHCASWTPRLGDSRRYHRRLRPRQMGAL
jgi:arylsulfatase A-like enzyme